PTPAAQYTAISFTEALIDAGIAPSIGTVGDALDNALMESTIGLYKTELIEHDRARSWTGLAEVERETASWVHWSRYAGDPPAGRWGRSGCGHHRDRRLLWRSCRAWSAPKELPAVR